MYVLGFSDQLQAQKTKWAFTEEVKAGKVNGFDVVADVNYDKRHIIEVRVFPEGKQMDKDEYKRLSQEFNSHHIEFGMDYLEKKYNTKHPSVFTIDELKRDLEEFTGLLLRNGFVPLKHDSE